MKSHQYNSSIKKHSGHIIQEKLKMDFFKH